MQSTFPSLFPEQASTIAGQVDALYLFLVLITTFFSLLIALLILAILGAIAGLLQRRAPLPYARIENPFSPA